MKYIVFDFNGTVLDDTDVGLKAENHCIEHFGLNRPPLTKDEYLHIFTFPVKDYYEKVGFDWNKFSYEEVGDYWFKWYCALKDQYKVHDGVVEFLKKSHDLGYTNILLSASKLSELKIQLKELGIEQYFDEVLGLDNIYAFSKVGIGKEWIKDKNPDDCFMIGDSLHDKEVADEMGIKCILVAKGHQAKDVLVKECKNVVDDIREIKI